MEEGNRPEDDIVTWINSFAEEGVSKIENYVELADGVALLQLLNKIDSSIWPFAIFSRDSFAEQNTRKQRLSLIYKGIQDFLYKILDIKIPDDVVDLSSIYELQTQTNGKLVIY